MIMITSERKLYHFINLEPKIFIVKSNSIL